VLPDLKPVREDKRLSDRPFQLGARLIFPRQRYRGGVTILPRNAKTTLPDASFAY